jgi:hypothetical protein
MGQLLSSAPPSEVGKRQFEAEVRKSSTFGRISIHRGSIDSTFEMSDNVRPLARIVKSRCFMLTFACLIVFSTLLIGLETQLLASPSYQGSGGELLNILSAANYMLTFLFTAELVARLYTYRANFFVKERVWNCFDMIIVILALVEVALDLWVHVFAGSEANVFDNGGTAKLLRLFRLTRLLRLIRTFRQLKPLRMLVHSIFFASRSVFWALLLLTMIAYSFGIILTQAVIEHTGGGTRVADEDLVFYFGSLHRSMLSLWMAVSGGINWVELTEPLERTGNSALTLLFLAYITFVYFFVLNVVTGVFCQNAIEGAQQDLDLTIEAQLKDRQVYVERLGRLLKEMRMDEGTGLTAAELQFQLSRPKVQSWFKALDIDTKQTWKLFKILDSNGSGVVSSEQFVEGCMILKGYATRVDVESLKWEIRDANIRSGLTAGRLAELDESIKELRAHLDSER